MTADVQQMLQVSAPTWATFNQYKPSDFSAVMLTRYFSMAFARRETSLVAPGFQ